MDALVIGATVVAAAGVAAYPRPRPLRHARPDTPSLSARPPAPSRTGPNPHARNRIDSEPSRGWTPCAAVHQPVEVPLVVPGHVPGVGVLELLLLEHPSQHPPPALPERQLGHDSTPCPRREQP